MPDVVPCPPDDPDGPLVQRLRDGDNTALAALVARHQRRLTRLVRREVRSAFVVDEIVQDTWIAFLDGLDRFEGRCRVGTWLARIARYKAWTANRREGRAVAYGGAEPEAVGGGPHPHALDHSDACRAADERAQLAGILAGLPPRYREAVVRCDLLDQARPDVCAALGISPGNLRVVLHRARRLLRAALQEVDAA
jgi:RNA polymerase sigma-70 factor (ECF subfamily)